LHSLSKTKTTIYAEYRPKWHHHSTMMSYSLGISILHTDFATYLSALQAIALFASGMCWVVASRQSCCPP